MSLPSVVGNDDYKDEAVQRYVLSRFLPGSFGEGAADMSGMDCFVAVIRHICSETDRELMDLVAANESLKFVMADFSAETEEKRNKVQEYRVAMFKKVKQMVGKKNPTFEDIVECEAVRKNFWTHYGLLLFQPLLYRNKGDEVWNAREDDSLFEATSSLIKWPLQDHTTIEDVLTKAKFGNHQVSDGGQVKFTFGKPAVVRIRLASKVSRATWQRGDFSIQDIRCFSYDTITRKEKWNEDKGTFSVSESASEEPKENLVYCLIAVVRLRNPGEDQDYVRLYDLESQNVLPHGDPKHLGTFDNKLWSLGDLDHDHMLYYARADWRDVASIRRGMEVGDQDPDPWCVRRDEMLLEGVWQRARALHEPPDFSLEVDEDDVYLSP